MAADNILASDRLWDRFYSYLPVISGLSAAVPNNLALKIGDDISELDGAPLGEAYRELETLLCIMQRRTMQTRCPAASGAGSSEPNLSSGILRKYY